MNWLVLIITVIAGGLLQVQMPVVPLMGGIKAPILLSLVIYYAVQRRLSYALACGVLAGVLQDALSMIPLGHSSLCFCLVAWVVCQFQSKIEVDSAVTWIVFGAVVNTVVTGVLLLLLVRGGALPWNTMRVMVMVPAAGLLGAVVAPVVCFVMRALDRGVGNVTVKKDVDEYAWARQYEE